MSQENIRLEKVWEISCKIDLKPGRGTSVPTSTWGTGSEKTSKFFLPNSQFSTFFYLKKPQTFQNLQVHQGGLRHQHRVLPLRDGDEGPLGRGPPGRGQRHSAKGLVHKKEFVAQHLISLMFFKRKLSQTSSKRFFLKKHPIFLSEIFHCELIVELTFSYSIMFFYIYFGSTWAIFSLEKSVKQTVS